MKAWAKAFYGGKRWEETRESYRSERRSVDGGLCEECKERLGYIVHHKIHLTPENINDPEVGLSFKNLEFVCIDCHNRIHGKNYDEIKDRVRYSFDEDGNPIAKQSPP